jgi:type VI secretion system secreted protein VgrG
MANIPVPVFQVRILSAEFDVQRVQVRRVIGREVISQPFSFDVEFILTDVEGLDGDKIIGSLISLVFERLGVEVRTVHGMVSELVDLLDTRPTYNSYRIRVVPRIHRLTFVHTQEVFLNISVPDLVQQKLQEHGLGPTDVTFRLLEKYPMREIIVQYRETDLAFVSRLLEHLGISFYFDQTGSNDKIIITDQNGGFERQEAFRSMHYQPRGEHSSVFQIASERHLFPTTWTVYDYDYRAPKLELSSTYEHPQGYAGNVAEYGSHHRTPWDGNRLAQARGEERDAQSRFFNADSSLMELTAGLVVKLTEHPKLEDLTLLIVEVEHEGVTSVGIDGGAHAHEGYVNKFKAVDVTRAYRPPRVTPRPRITGLLSAVTDAPMPGASGKVAQLDDMGRYTVKFFFDVADDGRIRSSAPTRMSQSHAGENYGMHFPLRPNTEVTVAFMDGDPDRPIILGAVPNPVIGSPVTKSDAAMNRIKSQSGAIIEFKDR